MTSIIRIQTAFGMIKGVDVFGDGGEGGIKRMCTLLLAMREIEGDVDCGGSDYKNSGVYTMYGVS